MKRAIAFLIPFLVPSYFIIQALRDYCLSLWRIGAFRDWHIFYDAGQAMRYGLSPFEVAGYFNPIQADTQSGVMILDRLHRQA